jgi:hypothetical protein
LQYYAGNAIAAAQWRRALAIGLLGVLTHLVIHSSFDHLFVQGVYLHLAFWFAALAAATLGGDAPRAESESKLC